MQGLLDGKPLSYVAVNKATFSPCGCCLYAARLNTFICLVMQARISNACIGLAVQASLHLHSRDTLLYLKASYQLHKCCCLMQASFMSA